LLCGPNLGQTLKAQKMDAIRSSKRDRSLMIFFVDRLERMSDLEDVKLENYPKVSHCKAEFQRDLLLCNSKTDALHLDRQIKSSCSVFLSVSSNL
jgi:hypothetical protein